MAYEDYQVGQIQNAVSPMEGVSHPSAAIRADQSFWADTVAMGTQKLLTSNVDDGQNELNADLNHVMNNVRNIRFAQYEKIIDHSQARKETAKQTALIISKYGANPKALEAINKAFKFEQELVGELDNWKDPVQEAREAYIKDHPEMAMLLEPTDDPMIAQQRMTTLDRHMSLQASFKQKQEELDYRQKLYNYNDGITQANYAAQDQNQQNIEFANRQRDRELMDLQNLNLSNTQSYFSTSLETLKGDFDAAKFSLDEARNINGDEQSAREQEQKMGAIIQQADSLLSTTINQLNSMRLSGNQSNAVVDQQIELARASHAGFMERITGKNIGSAFSGMQTTQDTLNAPPEFRGNRGERASSDFLQMQLAQQIQDGTVNANLMRLKDKNGNPIEVMSTVPLLHLAHKAMINPQTVASDVLSSIAPTSQKLAIMETLDNASRDAAAMAFSKGFDVISQVAVSEPDPTKQVQYYRQTYTNLAKPETLKGLNLALSDNSGVTVVNRNKLSNSIRLMGQSLDREWSAANNELGSAVVEASFVTPDGQVNRQVSMEDLVYVKYNKDLKRYNLEWREDVHEFSKANLSEQYHKLNTSIQSYQDTYLVNGVVSRNPRVIVDGQVNEQVGSAAAMSVIFGNPESTQAKAANDIRVQRLMTPGPAGLQGVSGVDKARASARTQLQDNQEANAETRRTANEVVQGIFGSDRKPAQ